MVSNEQWLVANLFFEDEVDGQNKAGEAHKVVPFKTLVHEDNHKEGEHRERDNLLDNLQVPQCEWTTMNLTTNAVGWYLEAVLQKGYTPAEEDDGYDAELLQLRAEGDVAIPRQSHEYV